MTIAFGTATDANTLLGVDAGSVTSANIGDLTVDSALVSVNAAIGDIACPGEQVNNERSEPEHSDHQYAGGGKQNYGCRRCERTNRISQGPDPATDGDG